MNKKISRRNLLKIGAAAGVGLATTPLWAFAQTPPPPKLPYLLPRKVTPVDKRAAAERAKSLGLRPGAAMKPAVMTPGAVPHYWGPYANYANSPMPRGGIASITVDAGGSGYSASPTVTITDVYADLGSLIPITPAIATATVANGVVVAITVNTAGADYYAPIVTITDATGTGALATAFLGGPLTGGIRKFVDSLAGIDPGTPNTLNQYIPVAVPDTTAYPGSDYYEIELGEFSQQFHSDLPVSGSRLRGYRQANSTDPNINTFHYLGPIIVANKDRPVRVLFINNLPTGAAGDLFIPVDETVMGAGEGPVVGEKYKQNRATLHLHGALSPWISDGTPHQWIVPAGETTTPYKKGASVVNVPDMWFNAAGVRVAAGTPGATNDPGPGRMTFYWTNQQSSRLLFYHDHAYGITRLNVYAGEAAGYLITDNVEKDLINGTNVTGVNPGNLQVLPDIGIPLVIQEKTFVDANTIPAQDPTWRWGTNVDKMAPNTGDLWASSVYMPAANPWDPTGANAFGRWFYGPFFWPPTTPTIATGNAGPTYPPYWDLNPYPGPGQPPVIPVMPSPAMGMELFLDTPIVNGVAYPFLELEAKVYRFRILNAANDRFYNLYFNVADPGVISSDGRANTEVKMVPAVQTPGFPAAWSTDNRVGGVPDPALMGPSWIQIGSEGGFLPEPVVIPPQPVNWNMNPLAFNVGVVTDHSLLLGCAERADVLVDFSQFAGQTLILYNDAPAAFPALNPQYDYYTGAPDNTGMGGAPGTQPGYGPNTRTIMQVRVASGTVAGTVDHVNVTSGGQDYAYAPEVVFSGGGGTGASATASGMLDHVTVLNPGSGYTLSPIIGFSGDGTGAAATAIVNAGKVTGIVVTNRGIGYTVAPTVVINNAPGDTTGGGATASSALTITTINLISGGTGYATLPTIYLAGGGGYGATASAVFPTGGGYDINPLLDVFKKTDTKRGVFEASQHPTILPQAGYNSAYNTTFPVDNTQYIQLQEFSKSFDSHILSGITLLTGGTGYVQATTSVVITAVPGTPGSGAKATATVTGGVVTKLTMTDQGNGYTVAPNVVIAGAGTGATASATLAHVVVPNLEPKAIHDEMNAAFEPVYGRMSGNLGLELPITNALNANLVLYGYAAPPVDVLMNSTSPLGTLDDGTTIWKITHNGVDTHPIHFHLVDVQLINRVAWDNALLPPDANELGWKETVRMNPLEHCIVAMRPIAPVLPFDLPNSVRLIDPTVPEGTLLMIGPNGNKDPLNNNTTVLNHKVNYGWEYVWHCHILSHEEMDMMHSLPLAMAPKAPASLTGVMTTSPRRTTLNWDNIARNATDAIVERATNAAFTANFVSFNVAGVGNNYIDSTIAANTAYYYRVRATNTVGDTFVYAAPSVGYPTKTAVGSPSNVIFVGPVPNAPTVTSITKGTLQRAIIRWTDNATDETNFTVQRSTNGGTTWTNITTTIAAIAGSGGSGQYTIANLITGQPYLFRMMARNAFGNSVPSNTIAFTY